MKAVPVFTRYLRNGRHRLLLLKLRDPGQGGVALSSDLRAEFDVCLPALDPGFDDALMLGDGHQLVLAHLATALAPVSSLIFGILLVVVQCEVGMLVLCMSPDSPIRHHLRPLRLCLLWHHIANLQTDVWRAIDKPSVFSDAYTRTLVFDDVGAYPFHRLAVLGFQRP
ncbi:TPA: hypothetical protein ACKTE9_006045 [Pseudomonas aeruginosa]